MVKTPGSQFRWPGFNPWSGNWIPYATTKRMHATTDFKKKKERKEKISRAATKTWSAK